MHAAGRAVDPRRYRARNPFDFGKAFDRCPGRHIDIDKIISMTLAGIAGNNFAAEFDRLPVVSAGLCQQPAAIHRERYSVDEAVAHQEQHGIGDFFGPADSSNRNPFYIHFDERVLALAQELIDQWRVD
jgi:hypothetical protein